MSIQKAVDPKLFDWTAASPHLWGSRCANCGNVSFPIAERCSRCSHHQQGRIALDSTGILWSWPVQRFPPASPAFPALDGKEFQPFALGYVELVGQVRIIRRLFYDEGETPAIGQKLTLSFEKLYSDTEGCEVIGYGFSPRGNQE